MGDDPRPRGGTRAPRDEDRQSDRSAGPPRRPGPLLPHAGDRLVLHLHHVREAQDRRIIPVSEFLSRRREFLFLYDIRMGNPNGDPDENRPRRLPDGTFYVTDVRLKRFVRDWLKTQGHSILVDRPEDAATNLTSRIQHFLRTKPAPVRQECEEYEKLINL